MIVVVVAVIISNEVEDNGGGYSIAQFTIETKSSKIDPVNFSHGGHNDAVEQ